MDDSSEDTDSLTTEGAAGADALVLASVFPEPHEIFAFEAKTIPEIVSEALFVLDTGALIRPFGVGDRALDDLQKLYVQLKGAGRLFVAAHAAREFAHHRAERIKSLHQTARDAKKQLRTQFASFARFRQYERVRELESGISTQLLERDKLLDEIATEIQMGAWTDRVAKIYREVFTKDVVISPDIANDELKADVIRRLEHKLPPGYKDGGKSNNAGGDIHVWHAVLALGRLHKRHIILVSGDRKSGWFYRSKKVALFPRTELLDEYRRASEGRTFQAMSFDEFLTAQKVSDEVVQEIKLEAAAAQAARFVSQRPAWHWGRAAEDAVARWVNKLGFSTELSGNFCAFTARRGGDAFNVDVRLASSKPLYVEKALKAVSAALSWNLKNLVLVFVALDKANADSAVLMLGQIFAKRKPVGYTGPLAIVVGYLDKQNGEFQPVTNLYEGETPF